MSAATELRGAPLRTAASARQSEPRERYQTPATAARNGEGSIRATGSNPDNLPQMRLGKIPTHHRDSAPKKSAAPRASAPPQDKGAVSHRGREPDTRPSAEMTRASPSLSGAIETSASGPLRETSVVPGSSKRASPSSR